MALNALDGMLAREFGQKSPLGAYLNELGDVVSDAALYAPFALIAPFGPLGVGSVIVLAAISEFAGALGPMVGASRRYEGPMGKSDRAVVFGALALWIGVGGALPDWLGLLMPLLAGLLVLTIVNRVRARARRAGRGDCAERRRARCGPAAAAGGRGALPDARRRRAVLPLLAGDLRAAAGRDRAVPSRARALAAAWRTWSTSSTCPTSPSSPGTRAVTAARRASAGYSPSLGTSVRDVQSFVEHIASAHGIAARGHRRRRAKRRRGAGRRPGRTIMRPTSACMVLASPAFKVKLYVPFARVRTQASLRSCAAIFSSTSYVKAKFLTHDPERIALLQRRPADHPADRRRTSCWSCTRLPSASWPTRGRSSCRRSC